MKILFDPVYTQRPHICSTSYLVWNLIEDLCKWRDDIFFYVVYPPNKDDEESRAFLNRYKDRVTLLPLEQCTSDRMSELYMLRNKLRFYLNPWCEATWDADIVISSRIPVLKHMQVHASRQLSKNGGTRMFVGLEEMPILPFRDTVAWSDHMYPDTVMSYALSDAVIACHQWLKSGLRPVLREVLSPAWQKRVLDKIHEALPVKLSRLNMKTTSHEGKFKVVFVGRMTGTRNFGDVAELFRRQFAYTVGKREMEFLISTNSESMGAGEYGETDFIDIQKNNRDQFYAFLKEADVGVNLSTVEDFSLSTYETLLNGVPLIVQDKPWNQFLGKDYPFRVKSNVEAYGMVSAFASDYDGMYAKFKAWEETYWKDYVEGPLNVTASETLIDLIKAFEVRRREHTVNTGGVYRERSESLKDATSPLDLTQYLKDGGTIKMSTEVSDSFSLALARTPNVLSMKLLMQEFGWRDSNKCGVFVK
jgi:glycosyltransferase involved in cell wall biosynthesis